MESSWLFLNLDELLYRGWLVLSWLWDKLHYIFTFQWLGNRADVSVDQVFDELREAGISSREAGEAIQIMREKGMSNLEMISAIRDLKNGDLSGGALLDAIANINPLDYALNVSETGDGLFKFFSSRPSADTDSIDAYLNPVEEQNIFEALWTVLTGGSSGDSIFSLLFGTFFGWVFIIALLLYIALRYIKYKLHFIEHKHEVLYELAHSGHVQQNANNKASRWQQITEQVSSDNPQSWRLAIIDADILLDEVLSEQGYAGTTVAEKLADARRDGSLTTIEFAGEAHGIRNKLAHQAGYELTHREAKSAISMMERFFNEIYHL